jgi:hypothetical protein
VTQRLLIVLFTALVFGAGFGAHMWLADDTVPPPPAAIGSEFAHGPGTPAASPAADSKNAKRTSRDQPLDRTKLLGEIQRYSSQIKGYRSSLDRLDADFDGALTPLLDATQRGRYAALQKRWADRRAKGEAAIAAETAPLSDEQIFRLQQRPLYAVLSSVSVTMRFDRELLTERRAKFLALIDDTPPPTITLSQIALAAEKIAVEAAPPR